MTQVAADLEIVETRTAKTDWRERERVVEVTKMRKTLEEAENRISMLEAESSELRDEKVAVEVDLDKTIDDTLMMLGQSFDQVVRQTHLLYNEPQPFGDFDVDMDIFEGRMVPCSEMQALKSTSARHAPTEDAEDEDH